MIKKCLYCKGIIPPKRIGTKPLFCDRMCSRRFRVIPNKKNMLAKLSSILARCREADGGCLEWSGYKKGCGYAQTTFFGKTMVLHRAAWLASGRKIPKGKILCHHCDNRACVNFEHLFVGTHKDNTQDMIKKGRHAQSKKTHCPRGHELSGHNIKWIKSRWGGANLHRTCRTCAYAATKEWVASQ